MRPPRLTAHCPCSVTATIRLLLKNTSTVDAAEAEVRRVLQDHPKVLLYKKGQDASILENGRSRVKVVKRPDGKVMVTVFRAGASL